MSSAMDDACPRWRSVDDARKAGWQVAVHNDYRLRGQQHTFWLFTHPCGLFAKGEGTSDADAIAAAYDDAQQRMACRAEGIEDRRALRAEVHALGLRITTLERAARDLAALSYRSDLADSDRQARAVEIGNAAALPESL